MFASAMKRYGFVVPTRVGVNRLCVLPLLGAPYVVPTRVGVNRRCDGQRGRMRIVVPTRVGVNQVWLPE